MQTLCLSPVHRTLALVIAANMIWLFPNLEPTILVEEELLPGLIRPSPLGFTWDRDP
jgi:hypothetical protein